MADCTHEIEIGKNSFHIKDNVFTKLLEFLETLNRTILSYQHVGTSWALSA